jgi:hypothetical protein
MLPPICCTSSRVSREPRPSFAHPAPCSVNARRQGIAAGRRRLQTVEALAKTATGAIEQDVSWRPTCYCEAGTSPHARSTLKRNKARPASVMRMSLDFPAGCLKPANAAATGQLKSR